MATIADRVVAVVDAQSVRDYRNGQPVPLPIVAAFARAALGRGMSGRALLYNVERPEAAYLVWEERFPAWGRLIYRPLRPVKLAEAIRNWMAGRPAAIGDAFEFYRHGMQPWPF